jgi:hypothetical protein
MGCLLFELAVGKRAFHNDYAVLEYSWKKEPFAVPVDTFLEMKEAAKGIISDAIVRMLQKEPSERPSAATLYDEFNENCQIELLVSRQHPAPQLLQTTPPTKEGKSPPSCAKERERLLPIVETTSPSSQSSRRPLEHPDYGLKGKATGDTPFPPQTQIDLSRHMHIHPSDVSYPLIDFDEPITPIDPAFIYPPPPLSATSSASPASAVTDFWSPTLKDSPLTPLDHPNPFYSNAPISTLRKPFEPLDDAPNSPASPEEAALQDIPHEPPAVNSTLPEQNTLSASHPPPRPPRLVINTTLERPSSLQSNSNNGDVLRSPVVISTTSRNFPTPEEQELRTVSSPSFPAISELKSPRSPVEKFKNFFRWSHSKDTVYPPNPRSAGSRLGNSPLRHYSRALNNSRDEISGSPSPSPSPGTHILLRYPDNSVLGGRLESD